MKSQFPRVGVSSCLLGQNVRYDGKEKRHELVASRLATEVELVAICPEVGAGMPIPRPPIRVVHRGDTRRLVVVDEGRDCTEAMQAFIDAESERLAGQPLDGYVFKARSPSCGLRDTPQFASHESLSVPLSEADGRSGLWADALSRAFPDLPVIDEEELAEPGRYQAFVAQVRKHCRSRRGLSS